MDRVHRERRTAVEASERLRDQLAGRCEDNCGIELYAGIVAGRASPDGAEVAGEAPVMLLARERIHLASPMQRHLDCEMGGCPEAEQPKPPARLDLRQP